MRNQHKIVFASYRYGCYSRIFADIQITLHSKLTGPQSNDIPIATSELKTQILVYNILPQKKQSRLFGETVDSRAKEENTWGARK